MKYCTKCGAQCLNEDTFCPKCGSPLKAKKSDADFFGVLGIIALFLSLAPIVLCVMGKSRPQHGVAFSVAAFIFAVIMTIVTKYIKRQIPETLAIRGFATLAFVISVISMIVAFGFTACTGFEGFTDMACAGRLGEMFK